MSRESWVFDWYVVPGGMAVWLLEAGAPARRRVEPWSPVFYARGRLGPRAFAGLAVERAAAERLEFFSGRPVRVTAVRVADPADFPRAVRAARRLLPPEDLFDVDIPLEQLWAYDRGLFPLARVDPQLRPLDAPEDLDYPPPPLRTMELGLEGTRVHAVHRGRPAALEVRFDGSVHVLEPGAGALDDMIRRFDPDVIATRWGDECLVPLLERAGVDFHRDPEARPRGRARRTYHSYGRIQATGGTRPFAGRWHLDLENSFILREAGLDGLIDLARLTRLPIQQLTRSTIGTGLTSMQLEQARRDGVLIPCRKRQTEDFKSAAELLDADKGGLTYVPPPGPFGRVAELDFASMYPTIMVRFNLSPETVNCACCPDGARVPEIGHRVCGRRRGLVPRVLEPVLARRAEYKRRRDAASDPLVREQYERRQTALKWMLVTSFGYLGFKNARFGKIEAHEAVTAHGREALLRAKEVAEARGFRMLHAIVDSLWIQGPGDARALAAEIERTVGLPVGCEGLYPWILFLPARGDARLGVHNRYCGAREDGALKVRGLELRRHDTPPVVRRMQQALLEKLAPARDVADLRARAAAAVEDVRAAVGRVRDGEVSAADLAISRTLTRAPREYRQDNHTAIVARQLAACGVELTAGERVAYIVMDERNPVHERRVIPLARATESWEYDPAYYEKLLWRAAESVLEPLGIEARPHPRPSLPLFDAAAEGRL